MEKKSCNKKDRKLLAGIVLLTLLIIVILGGLFVFRPQRKKNAISAVMAEGLSARNFPFLSGDKGRMQNAAETAVSVLETLHGTVDREEWIQEVNNALLESGLGLSEEEAAELTEWLVDYYVNFQENTETVTGGESVRMKNENILVEQMQQDLASIYDYLSKLDETVINNKKEIGNLTNAQEGSFDSINQYLESLKGTINGLQKQFTEYETNYSNIENLTTLEFGNINLQLEGMTAEIENTKEEINETIHKSDISNAERFESLNNTVNHFSSSIREDLESVNKNISKLISDIQKDTAEQNKELAEKIAETHEELLQVIDTMDQKWTFALEQIKEKLTAEIEESHGALSGQISSAEKTLAQGIDSGVSQLLTNLDKVHEDITRTQSEIKNILSDMDAADEEKMTDIISRFAGVNNKLVDIKSAMETAHNDIKGLISSLQTSTEKNQEKLLESLTAIDSSLSTQNSVNFELLVNSLQTQTDTVQNWFDSLNSKVTSNFENLSNTVTNMGQSASQNKEEVLNNLNQSFTHLSAALGNIGQAVADSKDEIMDRISSLEISTTDNLNKLSNDVQSVFQRASNGKQLLASALLAKNVLIKKDAAFKEFYDAILSIDQQIVIGVEEVPGTITYDYHYHEGNAAEGSGCYTKKRYHQHSPECYTKATCTVTVHGNGGFWSEGDDWCPCHGNVHKIKQNVIRKHSSCGAPDNYGQISFTEHHGPGIDGFHGYDSSTHSYDRLSCGKTNATFVGWDVGCGMVDGQIIGAHIVYDTAVQAPTSVSKMMVDKSYIPKRYDDYILIPNSGMVNWEEEAEAEIQTEEETDMIPEETDTESGVEAEGTESTVETKVPEETIALEETTDSKAGGSAEETEAPAVETTDADMSHDGIKEQESARCEEL